MNITTATGGIGLVPSVVNRVVPKNSGDPSEDPRPDCETGNSTLISSKSRLTETNTERSGYREMMHEVEPGLIELVVHEISRLARSLQDLERTVSRITDNGVAVHFVRDGPSFRDGK